MSDQAAKDEITEPKDGDAAARKRYATVLHPTIEAVVSALFRLPSEEAAMKRLASIRDYFIISRSESRDGKEVLADTETATPPAEADPRELKLWIKGFGVSEEDEKKGFLGNYALLRVTALEGGKWTITAEKLDVPAKNHPQRKRIIRHHPNWGHPVLRNVKKKKLYPSPEEARKALLQLHEEFPDVSIPNNDKLFIITYARTTDGSNPIQKIVLEIKPSGHDGCIIDWRPNDPARRKLPGSAESKKPADAEGKGEEKGYFTTMVEIKRRRKVARPKPTAKKNEG